MIQLTSGSVTMLVASLTLGAGLSLAEDADGLPTITATTTADGYLPLTGGTLTGSLTLSADAAQVTTTYSGVTVTRFFTDTGGGVIAVDGSNNIQLRTGGTGGANRALVNTLGLYVIPANSTAPSLGMNNIMLGYTYPYNYLTYGTDGTGYGFRIGKTQGGTFTTIAEFNDNLLTALYGNLILAGSPTSVMQVQFGNSSVYGAVGTMYSSGGAFLTYNAVQTTKNADNWAQSAPANPSIMLTLTASGLSLNYAGASKSSGTYSAFWGGSVFVIGTSGGWTSYGTSQNAGALYVGFQNYSASGAASGDLVVGRSASTGYVYFGAPGSAYMGFDGTNFTFGGAGYVNAQGYRYYSGTGIGVIDGTTSSWGSVRVSGTRGNYVGVECANGYGGHNRVFMNSTIANYGGIADTYTGAWDLKVSGGSPVGNSDSNGYLQPIFALSETHTFGWNATSIAAGSYGLVYTYDSPSYINMSGHSLGWGFAHVENGQVDGFFGATGWWCRTSVTATDFVLS